MWWDVEDIPAFYDALDWLTNEGIIFRSDAPTGLETTYREGYLRYKLSYPAEVYRLTLAGQRQTQRLETYDRLQIENVTLSRTLPKSATGDTCASGDAMVWSGLTLAAFQQLVR